MIRIEDVRDIVEKYDRPGPRYTSYPTAVQFTEEFGLAEGEAAIRRAASHGDGELSAYIHVPFCEKRCTYCGCHVIPTSLREASRDYVTHLRKEIRDRAGELGSRRTLKVLHMGGGTPTYLDADQLEELVGELLVRFPLAPNAELSIEVDPRVTTVEQLERLIALGFNRISLGVQDTSPAVQEAIGRFQSLEQTRGTYTQARRLGFEKVNFDLVYGLPTQTKQTLERTLDDILAMRPDRIAFYGYAHVPWMRSHQKSIDPASIPTGLEKLELFLRGRERFLDGGYDQVGMDHFALPSDDLVRARDAGQLGRNFMGYTPHSDLEILGLGISSISSVGGAYLQNHKKLAPYYRDVDAGNLPIERGVRCTGEDEIRRWVIHSILCNFRVEGREFERRHGKPFWQMFGTAKAALAPLIEDGLAEIKGDDLHVTPLGWIFVRNVAMVFDAYLGGAGKGSAGQNRFSRTV